MPNEEKLARKISSAILNFKQLLNLRTDFDEQGTVQTIRDQVTFRSSNAWTLVFAIFVASLGLNTNSAAVIIGAMLISPLMGPIVGAGLALGINDFELLKRSAQNLMYAVGISILTSACYFLISPLSEVQSELLARTQPTFFDVLVALFGGAAGIIALSRKEKGNAIPGVAIATALMPPLCTAGFGLANGEIQFFIGALYLFVINSVFICLSTYTFVRLMKFQMVVETDPHRSRQINRWIAAISFVVLIPSVILAWHLQEESRFKSKANSFINKEVRFDSTFVVSREISFGWKDQKISISLLGEALSPEQISGLKAKMSQYDMNPSSLEIHQASLEENLEKRIGEKLQTKSHLIQDYEVKLSQREMELQKYHVASELGDSVTSEISSIFPNVQRVDILLEKSKDSDFERRALVTWKGTPVKTQLQKVTDFLEKRIQIGKGKISHSRALRF